MSATHAVIAELMDRRLLNDVDEDLHREIAEAVIKAAQPAVDDDEPLSARDLAMIDQAWENYKAALPVATVINDNQPGRTAIIEITIDPPTLPVGTKLYAGPKMVDRLDVKAEAKSQEAEAIGGHKRLHASGELRGRVERYWKDRGHKSKIDAVYLKGDGFVRVEWSDGKEFGPFHISLSALYTHPTTKPEAPAVSVDAIKACADHIVVAAIRRSAGGDGLPVIINDAATAIAALIDGER